MKTKLFTLLSTGALIFAIGCGDSQDVDDGTDSETSRKDSDPGAETGPTECDTTSNTHVLVTYNGNEYCVDLAPLEVVKFKGERDARKLSDVWAATRINTPALGKKFDFLGNDGFRSSSKGKCADLLEGEKFVKGYILKENKKLAWDEADDVPGCFAVKDTAKIVATNPE